MLTKKRFLLLFWGVFLSFFVGLLVVLWLISFGFFGEMPSFETLENPKSNLASEIISSDNQLLGKYYLQNRSFVAFNEISPNLINALIATEDIRFYNHSGVDIRGLGRALVFIGKKGGASTITQQLAKNLFHGQGAKNKAGRLVQKLKEWIIALRLEKSYTKDEILAMYFNTVDFGYSAFGIKSAAKTYFNKSPNQLTVNEAALLVGLLKGTALYSPVRNPENALARRNTVIDQMNKYGFVVDPVAEQLKNEPIQLAFKPQSHATGLATYFREFLRIEIQNWLDENPKPDGSKYNLYKDGLKIYTTLDSKMQQYAEDAVNEYMPELQASFFSHWKGRKDEPWSPHNEIITQAAKRTQVYKELKQEGKSDVEIEKALNKPVRMSLFSWNGNIDTVCSLIDSIKYAKKFLHTGLMAMNPTNGHVKAWVGGINIDFSQYDHVNVNAKRQAGSTFKPFVYTVAIDNGIQPCMKVPNEPVSFPDYDNWTPKNYDGKNGGSLNLFQALALSINNIVAYLMKIVGPQAVIEQAQKMGIVSHMDPYPSLCLGTFDMSVYEMVGAYGVFANKGIYTKPIYLLKIEDKNGNTLVDYKPQSNEALSEETAYTMSQLMQGVVNRGTGYRLRGRYGFQKPFAGKTGTTQNNSDGWFIGYNPEIVVGCWTGADDRSVHFRTTHLGGGANMALPTVAKFLNKIYSNSALGLKGADFEKPQNELKVQLDCNLPLNQPDSATKQPADIF